MVAVVEAFTVVEAVESAPVALAVLAAGRMHRLLRRGTGGRAAQPSNAQGADMRRGRGIAMLPAQAIISRAAINDLETPLQRPQPSRTASGIPSAVERQPRALRAFNRKAEPLETREGFASLAGIDSLNLPEQCEAFRARAEKCGKTRLGREMSFPGLSRFRHFTIRLAAHDLRDRRFGPIRRFPQIHASPAALRRSEIEDFWVA